MFWRSTCENIFSHLWLNIQNGSHCQIRVHKFHRSRFFFISIVNTIIILKQATAIWFWINFFSTARTPVTACLTDLLLTLNLRTADPDHKDQCTQHHRQIHQVNIAEIKLNIPNIRHF